MQDSEILVDDIVNFLPDATVAIDKNGRVIVWNRAIEKMTGVPADEMLGEGEDTYAIPFHGEARPILIDLLSMNGKDLPSQYKDITQVGGAFMGEVFCKSLNNGDGAWVFVKAAPLHDASGNVIGAIEIIRDITAQKISEIYSNLSREILLMLNEPCDLKVNLQRIVTLLKDKTGFDAVGIRLQDGDDYPYFCSDGFPDGFLLKEQSILEHSVDGSVCYDKDGNVCLECTCGMVIRGKIPPAHPLFRSDWSFWTNDSFSLLELTPDQDPRKNPRNECIHLGYASFALVPIRNDEKIIGLIQLNDKRRSRFTLATIQQLEIVGSYIGSLIVHQREATEKKNLEAHLYQAQRLESVGLLAGGIAHDFKNMLTVILGYTQLALAEKDSTPKIHEWLNEVEKATVHSANLTNQLLTFARRQPTDPVIINLNEVVPETLGMLQKLIGDDIRLTWGPVSDLWSLRCDPSHISTILTNLCINSRDAISNSGTIHIEVENCTINNINNKNNLGAFVGDYVRISVKDNGSGMSQETVNLIFDPFFTTKEIGKGTGLGLSIVFGIVKQNNGFIEVHSDFGVGTTFLIHLPRFTGVQNPTNNHIAPSPQVVCNESILLVEDEVSILNMLAAILTKQGYTVIRANNPEKAILLAKEHDGEISLIVTDVIMPTMNGYDLSKKLTEDYPKLKCLFMSGYTADVLADHGVEDSGLFFIQKPFGLNSFVCKVREVLDSKQACWVGMKQYFTSNAPISSEIDVLT